MHLSRPDADIFIPDGQPPEMALARVTHLCVAAHQDDIEIMAHAGIAECYEEPVTKAFGGVVLTNGAGAPRAGQYAALTDDALPAIRRAEQRQAATRGHYAIQLQLGHTSHDVKATGHPGVLADLVSLFAACTPQVVYLHNLADKHDTHVACALRCLEALRDLPRDRRPRQVLGCEVWRGLDWLADEDKVALDAGRQPELAARLLAVFDSQIAGGKRYDLAALGRRAANATFHTAHATDRLTGINWAMDLTPLVHDETLSVKKFVLDHVERLRLDIVARLLRYE